MDNKYPHLYFKNPSENFKGFKYGQRGNKKEMEIRPPEYFEPKAIDFYNSLQNYSTHLTERIQQRNQKLNVSKHIEYVEILFHGSFDEDSFGEKYKNKFGLSGIKFDELNSRVVFAIVDLDAFNEFIRQINLYLDEVEHNSPEYDTVIRYIKEFDLLTTKEMLSKYSLKSNVHYIDLVDDKAIFDYDVIKEDFLVYLNNRQISYHWDETNRTIEVQNVTTDSITEICNNYDIILSVNSVSTARVSPGKFGEPERDYPFEVNFDNDVPVIGIIDTGISDLTPLKSILINSGNDFDRFKNNPLLDNVGHGTSVGAFAALGKFIAKEPQGTIEADARLLSMKVLDNQAGDLPVSTIEGLIRKAYQEKNVRLFVLTINFSIPKRTNTDFSAYAYALDKLTHELDILIFISTGNYDNVNQQKLNEYPTSFINEEYNIQIPAESLNNLTVGSVGDNFKDLIAGISDKNHPTIYTRTYHLDFENSSKHKVFKPDLVFGGGNYDADAFGPYSGGDASMQALSQPYNDSGKVEFFYKNLGTSFSTPLVANLAAKLMRLYPELNCQSYKALLINSTEQYKKYAFNNYPESQTKYIIGNGIPLEENLLYSNNNQVIMVLEDKIHPGKLKKGTVKYYRLNIPEYLNKHPNNSALLEINITLCFKTLPVKDNHIAYNPIHMAFNLFKNLTDEELNKALGADTKIKSSVLVGSSNNWSQDAYYKGRILSNSQKVRYTVSKDVIKANDNTFVLAVNCIYHKMIRKVLANNPNYKKDHDFSIAISIRENAAKSKLTGRLYNEIQAINTLENIGDIELEAEN
ncbi:S8 family peptidase [Mesoflavibacter zeaxanthinifaciens]|uniref:S8 family peptidase n=1 Tax=Mesoflavibacter zeaxanthinifaciens TaxID=393060 RepID=UPI003A91ECC2